MSSPALKQHSARSALLHVLAQEIIRELRAERTQVAANQATGQNQTPAAPYKP